MTGVYPCVCTSLVNVNPYVCPCICASVHPKSCVCNSSYTPHPIFLETLQGFLLWYRRCAAAHVVLDFQSFLTELKPFWTFHIKSLCLHPPRRLFQFFLKLCRVSCSGMKMRMWFWMWFWIFDSILFEGVTALLDLEFVFASPSGRLFWNFAGFQEQ